jgi:hypothetical protein
MTRKYSVRFRAGFGTGKGPITVEATTFIVVDGAATFQLMEKGSAYGPVNIAYYVDVASIEEAQEA